MQTAMSSTSFSSHIDYLTDFSTLQPEDEQIKHVYGNNYYRINTAYFIGSVYHVDNYFSTSLLFPSGAPGTAKLKTTTMTSA